MIDSIFWCINTGILALLGYYLYKTQLKASLEQQMFAQKTKQDSLVNQAGLLDSACLRIKKETDEQEKVYLDLHNKIVLWKNKVSACDQESEAQWELAREALEKKRKEQREHDILNQYKKKVVQAVIAQTAQELHCIFSDKNKANMYTMRILETMKKS